MPAGGCVFVCFFAQTELAELHLMLQISLTLTLGSNRQQEVFGVAKAREIRDLLEKEWNVMQKLIFFLRTQINKTTTKSRRLTFLKTERLNNSRKFTRGGHTLASVVVPLLPASQYCKQDRVTDSGWTTSTLLRSSKLNTFASYCFSAEMSEMNLF